MLKIQTVGGPYQAEANTHWCACLGSFPIKMHPQVANMRTVVRVSPWKTGMKHPLTYMWIRFGNDLGWASLQHLLAGMSQEKVHIRLG